MELKPVIVLTANPAILLLGMEVYIFRHIEATRLLPFTKKTKIRVDASLTEKYIDNILIPLPVITLSARKDWISARKRDLVTVCYT